MRRTAKDHRDMPHPDPVKKIELSEKGSGLRFVLVILFIAVAVIAFAFGVTSLTGSEAGWTTIEVNSSAELNCGSEFVFQYRLGESGMSATAENKALSLLYTDAMVKAYQLFDNNSYHGEMHNVYYLNQHPNEELEVDSVLYHAFELCTSFGVRNHYLAPAYRQYDSLFYCKDDWETEVFDPLENEQLALFFSEVAQFAKNSDQVELQLLGNNHVKLFVSDAYLAYAKEEGISDFVDFYWMKNAFIIDYVADLLKDNGFLNGSLASYDGFMRTLDESGTGYAFTIYDRNDQMVYPAAVMNYSGAKSIVCLRDYPINNLDFQHYYERNDGQIRTPYLDIQDGLPRTSLPNVVAYSTSESCSELLLWWIPLFVTEKVNLETSTLPQNYIYSQNYVIYYNDGALNLTDLYSDEKISYNSYLVEQ